jgi:hypothetical protein
MALTSYRQVPNFNFVVLKLMLQFIFHNKRYTTVDKTYNIPVNVSGVTTVESIISDLHPKNPEVGQKTVWRTPVVLIDGVDAETLQVTIYLLR